MTAYIPIHTIYQYKINDPTINYTIKIGNYQNAIKVLENERHAYEKAIMLVSNLMPKWRKNCVLARLRNKQCELTVILSA